MPTTPNYYAVQFPTFQQAMRNILSITNAENALVTTTFDGVNPGDHQYSSGLIVRLIVPEGFGMQLSTPQVGIESVGAITVINSTQFTIPIDTTNLDPFVVPSFQPGHYGTPAVVTPVGEINSQLDQATRNILPYP